MATTLPARLLPVHLEPEHLLRPLPAAAAAVSLDPGRRGGGVERAVDAADANCRAPVRNRRDRRADARRRSPRRRTRRSGTTPTPPRSGRRSRRIGWIRRELPPGTSIRLEGSLAIKLPASYKHQLREAAASRRLTGLHRRRASSTWSRRLSATDRYFENPAAVPRGVRGLPADLRADRGSRALHAGDRSSGPRAHHPEGEAVTVRLR